MRIWRYSLILALFALPLGKVRASPLECAPLLASKQTTLSLLPALRVRGERILQTPLSRAAFLLALDYMEHFLNGGRPSQAPVTARPELERLEKELVRLIARPRVRPTPQQLDFARSVLLQIRAALAAPLSGQLPSDAWLILATDAMHAITPLVTEVMEEDRSPKILAGFLGDRIENILAPVYLTTAEMSVRDFNEAAVTDVILAGLVFQVTYTDGLKEGETPDEFLLSHDLGFHGDAKRRQLRHAPLNAETWLKTVQHRLDLLEQLHAAAQSLSPLVHDAQELIRFFAEHEYMDRPLGAAPQEAQPTDYRSYLDQTFPTAILAESLREVPRNEIRRRLHQPHDLGVAFPGLAQLSEAELMHTLNQGAEFLDSVLSRE